MALTTTLDIVADARRKGCGAAAFNIVLLESIEAIVSGAEAAELPVILQISENAVKYHGCLQLLANAALDAAWAASVPVSVHLDHAESEALVDEAVDLGLSSVMYDASRLPYEENVASTRAVVERCHKSGVAVEAELGEIGGKDGVHAPGIRTDPAQAAKFVADTGVDALAVAVGSSHAMTTREARLDESLIAELADVVPVPLVLHGSSGVSNEGLTRAIAAGMTKINLSTHLNRVFTDAVRAHLADHPEVVDPRKYLAAGRGAMSREATALIRVIAG